MTIICDSIKHTPKKRKWTIKLKKSALDDFNTNHKQQWAIWKEKKNKPVLDIINSHDNEFNTVVEFQMPSSTLCDC